MSIENQSASCQRAIPANTGERRSKAHETGPLLWMLEQDRHLSVSEEFRSFKHKLLALQAANAYGVFMLTGTEGRVGTSTAAFNLALTLACDLADQKILLVDAHLERPALHSTFGISVAPGFLDYLTGKPSLEETVHASPLAGLDLMPLGQGTAEDGMLPFDMRTFTRFLDDVREIYDIVLLDTAPVLRVSQARIMAAKADGVILVFEANRTRSEVVGAARSLLNSDGARLLGGFLNRRRFVIPKWLYRYV